MIGLEIRFLTGRFHANPWQNAHNEGVPEWPPAPWRVLRALAAAAFDLDVVAEAKPILEKLAGLPRYRLPGARDAHTRHFMPDTDDAGHKRAKVFDTFIAVEGGTFRGEPSPLTVAWPVELTEQERSVLGRLARRVPYVGRAESWAELAVVDVDGDHFDCWPDETSERPSTALMALAPAEEIKAWSNSEPPSRAGRQDVPRAAWDVLTFDAERFRSEGWSKIPGTRLARYVFAREPFLADSRAPATRRRGPRPTVARFAIRSNVLPRIEDAILVGERMRACLMSRSGARSDTGIARPVFSGHFEDGLRRAHEHAFVLMSDERNQERRIDTVTVYAAMGFDADDVLAIQDVRRLYGRDDHFLELLLIGVGTPEEYGGLGVAQSSLLHKSGVWESVTPFVPTRHEKLVRGARVDDLTSQVRRACAQLGKPEPLEVEVLDDGTEWFRFQRRRRQGGGRRGPDRAFGLRLRFSEAVRGPIAIGYGAHFGLGSFRAVAPAS